MNDAMSAVSADYFELGAIATGVIGGSLTTHPRLDEFTKRVGCGEFHIATNERIPSGCIDGRCGGSVRPDTAGGTLSLAIADDLTMSRYATDTDTATLVRSVFHSLHERGFAVGDHTDEHASADKSGCGANDRLRDIYQKLVTENVAIRDVAAQLGVRVSDTEHATIVARAEQRHDFSSGRDVLECMRRESSVNDIDMLRGEHREVVAVINFREHTTLDRDVVDEAFGESYEAFNVDAWSFGAAAEALYPGADESIAARVVAAMVYYNLATAAVLCAPSMRVVVLR